MTAGSGLLHDEFHSEHFARSGGILEMVQLWVNLPAKDKMTAPDYQAIQSGDIPVAPLTDNAGSLRIIAGEYAGYKGPAKTFTSMQVWDMRLERGGITQFSIPEGWNTVLVIFW